MAKNVTQYDLLISCPGDIKSELIIIENVVENFNNLYEDVLGLRIRTKHWTKNAFAESGDKPQNLLNRQFINECDAVVSIFWTRFGTPTDHYDSGTEEEIENALKSGKQVFMYFSAKPIQIDKVDINQHEKVQQFKKNYKDKGIFFTYDSDEQLEKLFLPHLSQYFLTLKKVDEIIEQSKKPSLEVTIPDNLLLDFYFTDVHFPFMQIKNKQILYDDLTIEQKSKVTKEQVNKYNKSYPTNKQIDEYNHAKYCYEMIENNSCALPISIKNKGNKQATNIHLELTLSEGVTWIDSFQKEENCEPKRLYIPPNPLEILQNGSILNKFSLMLDPGEHVNLLRSSFEPPLSAIVSKDYSISRDKKVITLKIDNLLHTLNYEINNLYIVPSNRGIFKITISMICAEYDDQVIIERDIQVK